MVGGAYGHTSVGSRGGGRFGYCVIGRDRRGGRRPEQRTGVYSQARDCSPTAGGLWVGASGLSHRGDRERQGALDGEASP
jgi:hypothetical protein